MARPPSEPLLRTLAAVPPSSRVLDLGCGVGRHTVPLAALGFDYFACTPEVEEVEAARDALGGGDEVRRRVTSAHAAALGYPDDYFDWVVAHGAYDDADDVAERMDRLAETRRVLKPGGWVFVAMRARAVGPDATPEALTTLFGHAGFALAEAPAEEDEEGERLLRGIYRKVDAATPY